jgi:diguanylate cyclase (GGDEF)-like protein
MIEEGMRVSERIRSIVDSQPFQLENKSFPITISLGVSTTVGDDAMTPADLIRQADDKLYEAKRAGRNRVVA